MKITLGHSPNIPSFVLSEYVTAELERKKFEVSYKALNETQMEDLSQVIKANELDGILVWPYETQWKADKKMVLAALLRKLDSAVLSIKGPKPELITNNTFLSLQWKNDNDETAEVLDMNDAEFFEYLQNNPDSTALVLGTYPRLLQSHGLNGKKLKHSSVPFGCNQLIIVTNEDNTAAPIFKKLEPKNTRYLFDIEQTFYGALTNPSPNRVSCSAAFKDGKVVFKASALSKDGSQRVEVSSEDDPDDFGTDDVKQLVAQFIQKGANSFLADV